MSEPDLPQILQLQCFRHVVALRHLEERPDDVGAAVPRPPQAVHLTRGPGAVPRYAALENLPHGLGVGLIADLEDVRLVHDVESAHGGLEVVQRIPHIALGREYDSLESVVRVRHVLALADVTEPVQYLLVGEATVPQYRRATLDGLDDLRGNVARQRKSRRVGVDLHGAT